MDEQNREDENPQLAFARIVGDRLARLHGQVVAIQFAISTIAHEFEEVDPKHRASLLANLQRLKMDFAESAAKDPADLAVFNNGADAQFASLIRLIEDK